MGNNFKNLGIGAALLGSLLGKPAVSVGGNFVGNIHTWAGTFKTIYSRYKIQKTLFFYYRFFGDTVALSVEISNNKPLWVSLRCEDEVNSEWTFSPKKSRTYSYPASLFLLTLPIWEDMRHLYGDLPWNAHRGIFSFGPLDVVTQDPFGLYLLKPIYRKRCAGGLPQNG